jgi:serine/threonine protein kinase
VMAEGTDRGLVGKQLGVYKITGLLGVGGMGEVYRAEDTRLGRTVAVKVLPTELAQDKDRLHRFVREARAASAINHANVAHIYDIGQSGGRHFIAMEYVEGQSLAQKTSGQPLALGEILDIGIQAGDALTEAHEKGITHRDIKSANLMLTSKGQVKVLDFGLAKITRPEGQAVGNDVSTSLHTSEGRIMGTLGYMSPEQVLGKDLDARTDLFSLGVVLYEMTTGRQPFSGSQANEVMDRILHVQPDAIARFNYDVPPKLERIIRKCLEKDRERQAQWSQSAAAQSSREHVSDAP